MTRAWAIALVACACAAGNRQADEAKATACLDDINFTIAGSMTCQTAVANVAELTQRRPECLSILGDAGITLVCHDGGAHD